LSKQIKLVAIGECMMEIQANSFGPAVLAYGGDTFNTAVYLRRCSKPADIEVGYATGVGQDPLSGKLLNEWAGLGLNLTCTQKIAGKLPGMYLIETDDSGERRFHFWRDNSAARFYFNADPTPLESSAQDIDCFYFSGISLAILDKAARDRLFQILHAQKAAGKHVVFDNNYRPKLWPDRITTQKVFDQAFEVSTIALITADDHQAVFDLPDLDTATAHAKQRPVKEIVIKRGAAPSLVNAPETGAWLEIATQKVDKVVDTTAAGDSFAAGYLSRRLMGQSPAESATFGNKVASRVVQHRGAIIPAEAMKDLMRT
jgi:2-dehydro-3-deoxygluconokinase